MNYDKMQNIFPFNTIKCIYFTSLIRYYSYVDNFSDNFFFDRGKCYWASFWREGGGS